MELSEAKDWVDENIEHLMQLFGIPHWDLVVEYKVLKEEDIKARIDIELKYEHAILYLNYSEIEDKEQLETVIKHELSHIVHAPFCLLWDAITPYLSSQELLDSINSIYSYSKELTVKNIERLHRQHKDYYETLLKEKNTK